MICGVPWGVWNSKGRTVDSKPGTKVDGYSRHKQKKLVLQVSKKEGLGHVKGGRIKEEWEARGRVGYRIVICLYICAYVCRRVLSANNITLYLGEK